MLCLIGALHRAPPDPEHDQRHQDGGHAVEQQQDGLVALGIEIDLQFLVPDLLLGHGAQRGQHGQIVEAGADHEDDVRNLRGQEQQPLGQLLMGHVSKTHDQG